jgi:hypothetical protein
MQVAVLRDPTLTASVAQLAAIQSVAPSFRVELTAVNMRNAIEIERGVTDFLRGSNGGLIVNACRDVGAVCLCA